jgi:hypothetical protein
MRIFCAVAIFALLAGPAFAQEKPIPRYGDVATPKSPQEIEADKAADKAYKNSLGNIPDQGPVDPWGNARSSDAPKNAVKPAAKSAAKTAPAKTAKTGSTAN